MPDLLQSPFDKFQKRPEPMSIHEPRTATSTVVLPATAWATIWRGLRGRCARCGEARLFMRFLKPVPRCPHCGQDWTHQQADDFPAYISIFVTGHLMAPLIIGLTRDTDLTATALTSIVLPVALCLMIGMLQPAKGAVIALQWWFGMHGFHKERPEIVSHEAEA